MKKLFLITFSILTIPTFAQKVKTDNQAIWCTVFPKIILPDENPSFSFVIIENTTNAKLQQTTNYDGMNWNYETETLISGFKKTAPSGKRSIAITFRTEEFVFSNKTVSQMQSSSPTNGAMEMTYSYDLKANYILTACAVTEKGDTILKLSRNQGQLSSMNYPSSVKPVLAGERFTTSGQLDAAYNKNMNDIKILARKICSTDFLKFFKDSLNSMVGYPAQKLFFEIATAKSKSFSYSDLDSAQLYMEQAMDSVTSHCRKNKNDNWTFESSYLLVKKSIPIWEKALTEESKEKGARVNSELAAYIRQNLAYGYLMIDDYDKSKSMFSKCITDEELSKSAQRNCTFFMKTYFPKFQERFNIHITRLTQK